MRIFWCCLLAPCCYESLRTPFHAMASQGALYAVGLSFRHDTTLRRHRLLRVTECVMERSSHEDARDPRGGGRQDQRARPLGGRVVRLPTHQSGAGRRSDRNRTEIRNVRSPTRGHRTWTVRGATLPGSVACMRPPCSYNWDRASIRGPRVERAESVVRVVLAEYGHDLTGGVKDGA